MKFVGPDLQRQADSLSAFAGGSSDPLDLMVTDPAAPGANTVRLFRRSLAERQMPGFVGPLGLDTTLQPLLARNKIGYATALGNANTALAGFGMPSYTVTGTVTARNVAATSLFTRMRRLGYVSAATAGSFAVARISSGQITLGTTIGGVPVGGFFKVIRFGCSDAATVAGARQFCGIASNAASPSNAEPATLTNHIGVGHGAADANLKLFHGGSAAQSPIDLGANFPANTLSADVYELVLFCAPGSQEVGWQVTRLNTGHVASGKLTAATPGVQLPAPTTLMVASYNWRCNNATALAVGLDFVSDYIETDM